MKIKIYAFPYEESYNHSGMELRDYFAAMALTTFLIKTKPTDMTGAIASECYAMADAMMKAREL